MSKERVIERVVLVLISLSFFIGIWHGFPITNVVADEMFFSGSVLRSMEQYTIFPLPLDVPYGTITFYISYFFIGIGLFFMSFFYLFDLESLKFFITENPFIVYGFARLVSFGLGLFCLFVGNNLLKRYILDYRTRLAIITLLFTNILVNIIFHTSKVWVLSTVLMLISFYFLVRVFENQETNNSKKYIWYSVIFSFLSFSNFPFMGITLVCIPLILYRYWNSYEHRKTLIQSVLFGSFIFFLILLTNFSGIKAQVFSIIYDYTFSPTALEYNASLGLSAYLHTKKIVVMFPLLLLGLVYSLCRGKIKNRELFFLSIFYLIIYIGFLIVVDRWSTVDKAALRYSFPIPFFIAFLISSIEIKWNKFFLFLVTISVLYLVPTLYFLSTPTTSHKAISFIRSNFSYNSNLIIVNKVGADTPIPHNKKSYELYDENTCGSLCKATITHDLQNNFKPLVVLGAHTNSEKLLKYVNGQDVYIVMREVSTSSSLSLKASFTNPVEDLNYYSADNSGSYFDRAYFSLDRFGPNIYIYEDLSKIGKSVDFLSR